MMRPTSGVWIPRSPPLQFETLPVADVDAETVGLDADYVFLRDESSNVGAWLCLIGGVLALLFAVFGFLLAIFTGLNQLAMHGITTVPVLLGISLIGCAKAFWSTAQQVTVGPEGFRIDSGKRSTTVEWDDVAWANVRTGSLTPKKSLVLYGIHGEQLASFGDAFSDFDQLVELTKQHIAERDTGAAERVRMKLSRRSALTLVGTGAFLLLIAVANIWMALEEQRAARLLETATVEGEGKVLRRFVAPNGVTHRLEYSVTDEQGNVGRRNAEVTSAYWNSLDGVDTVPVRYVPGDPDISRLQAGEVAGSDESPAPPGFMIAASAVIGVLALGSWFAAALQWNGWDLDFNSKTNRLSFKRWGTS